MCWLASLSFIVLISILAASISIMYRKTKYCFISKYHYFGTPLTHAKLLRGVRGRACFSRSRKDSVSCLQASRKWFIGKTMICQFLTPNQEHQKLACFHPLPTPLCYSKSPHKTLSLYFVNICFFMRFRAVCFFFPRKCTTGHILSLVYLDYLDCQIVCSTISKLHCGSPASKPRCMSLRWIIVFTPFKSSGQSKDTSTSLFQVNQRAQVWTCDSNEE